MKRFLLRGLALLLLTILAAFAPHPINAHTSPTSIVANASTLSPTAGDYACILSDDTFFYSAADERRGMFLLPKTYYVRLLEYRADFCKIEYGKDESNGKRLIGYAKTSQLTFVDYVPQRPYLYYVFDVRYTIDGAEPNGSPFLNELTLSCVYYGDYLVGSEIYCYVLRGTDFGYIPKPTDLSFEENTEYADYLAAQTPPKQDETPNEPALPSENNSPMQIIILIGTCLLVPILAALVLKPSRRPPFKDDDVFSY